MNSTSQQTAVGADFPPRLSCVQIEQTLYTRLEKMCAKENISVGELCSELLRRGLIFEQKKVREIVEMLKCRPAK